MAFTEEEVQAAVDAFLVTEVAVPRFDGTGSRDVIAARDAVYDLLAIAFLLRPEAFFYLVAIAVRKLKGYVGQELELASELQTAAAMDGPLSRATYRIDSVTDLVGAKAAVLELNGALSAETVGVRASTAPAIQRFSRNVEAFSRNELAKNVVSGTEVVATPDEARGVLASSWAEAKTLRAEVETRLTALENAVSSFDGVRLPSRSLSNLATKISAKLESLITELSNDSTALASSRSALLNLLAMRTLLAKVAAFKAPAQVLASADTVVYRVDSVGIPPGQTGNRSGPFTYQLGNSFTLFLDSLPSVVITLPGDTKARVTSDAFTLPIVLSGAEFAVNYGYSSQFSVAIPDGSYATPADLGNAMNTAIGIGTLIEVDWNGFDEISFFHNVTEGSYIEILRDTGPRAAFVDAVLPGIPLVGTERPMETDDLVKELSRINTDFMFSAVGDGVLHEDGGYISGDLVVSSVVSGAGIAVGATWSHATLDFEALGVAPGQVLTTTSPVASYVITAVHGNVLETETVPTAGAYDFEIGNDLSSFWPNALGVTCALLVAGPVRLSGVYRAQTAPTGQKKNAIKVDRSIPGPITVAFTVQDRRIHVSSRTVVEGTELIFAENYEGMMRLGLPSFATLRPTLEEFSLPTNNGASVDLLGKTVRAGDTAIFASSTLAEADWPVTTVTEVTATGFAVSPGLPVRTTPWSVRFERTVHRRYAALIDAIDELGDAPVTAALDATMSRFVQGARPTAASTALIDAYVAYLEGLYVLLSGFAVEVDHSVDSAIRMLQEQGMDRALNILLGLDFKTFFSLSPDEVSYSTNLVRKAAQASTVLAPGSRRPRSQDGSARIEGLVQTVQGYDPQGTLR